MTQTADLIVLLQKAGLSQMEISRRTGIPQPRLSRWQGGAVPNAADDALKLARLVVEVGAGQPEPDKKGAHRAAA